jgi:malate synthase
MTTSAARHVSLAGLSVDADLAAFVADEACPGSGVTAEAFWSGFATVVADLAPKNAAALAARDALQAKIDAWHGERRGRPHDAAAYRAFLEEIGYLLPEPAARPITTGQVDDEIARLAGPQLVVPKIGRAHV